MKASDIVLPGKILYSIEIPVRIYDVNYGNHLGHDSLISILHEARMSFLKENNLSELDIFGIGWIMSWLTIFYQYQAYYGDVLQISIGVDDISSTSFDFVYFVTKTDKDGNSINIARAKTKMTFYDYTKNKVQKIPSQFLELIK